jgi:hypothetical protein
LTFRQGRNLQPKTMEASTADTATIPRVLKTPKIERPVRGKTIEIIDPQVGSLVYKLGYLSSTQTFVVTDVEKKKGLTMSVGIAPVISVTDTTVTHKKMDTWTRRRLWPFAGQNYARWNTEAKNTLDTFYWDQYMPPFEGYRD